MSEHKKFETVGQFDWRNYIEDPGSLPSGFSENLDALSALVNAGGTDAEQFVSDLNNGSMRKVLLTLVQYFRDILSTEERSELLEELRKHQLRGPHAQKN